MLVHEDSCLLITFAQHYFLASAQQGLHCFLCTALMFHFEGEKYLTQKSDSKKLSILTKKLHLCH